VVSLGRFCLQILSAASNERIRWGSDGWTLSAPQYYFGIAAYTLVAFCTTAAGVWRQLKSSEGRFTTAVVRWVIGMEVSV